MREIRIRSGADRRHPTTLVNRPLRYRLVLWGSLGLVAAMLVGLFARDTTSLRASRTGGGDHTSELPVAAARAVAARNEPGQLPSIDLDLDTPGEQRASEGVADSAWTPTSVELRQPEPGEVAPVRSVRLDTYDPTRPSPPPNPYLPWKVHLSDEDTRASLDPRPDIAGAN
jgi:hypothetical protein